MSTTTRSTVLYAGAVAVAVAAYGALAYLSLIAAAVVVVVAAAVFLAGARRSAAAVLAVLALAGVAGLRVDAFDRAPASPSMTQVP
jgi:hypothetical protein